MKMPASPSPPCPAHALDETGPAKEKSLHETISSSNDKSPHSPISHQIPSLGDSPNQPRDPRLFVNGDTSSRPFLPSWFDNSKWKSWLHYDVNRHAVFCFTCIKATGQNLISNKYAEQAFVSIGYKSWSQAATKGRGFYKHVNSDSHKEAHYRYHVAQDESGDIGDQLFSALQAEKSENRHALLKILSDVFIPLVASYREKSDGR